MDEKIQGLLRNGATKQEAFCVHYTTIGSETFANATNSAKAAGYSEKGAYVRGSELLKIRKIIDRISALQMYSRPNLNFFSNLSSLFFHECASIDGSI